MTRNLNSKVDDVNGNTVFHLFFSPLLLLLQKTPEQQEKMLDEHF